MDNKAKRLVQKLLKDEGLYPELVTGIFGPITLKAIAMAERGLHRNWNAVAYLQVRCKEEGLDPGPVDGYWGPRTEAASDDLYDLVHYGEIHFQRPEPVQSPFPVQYSKEFYDLFGETPDDAKMSIVRLPHPVRIAWDLSSTITRFSAHEAVAELFESIYVETLALYGIDEIKHLGLDLWGGCLNKRKVRGGTKWSMHSWGIAEDRDPIRNRLRWKQDRAEMAKPVYQPFWSIVEKHGGVSLGREADFDWMHYQFARVK